MSDVAGNAVPLAPLRRNIKFQLLWIGSATSVLGSQISFLAFPLVILALTGSPALTGIVGAVSIASRLILGIPAGALVDRWDLRRTLVGCEALRMVAMAVVALAVLQGWATIWLFVVVAAVSGGAGALVSPALAVAIRLVVPRAQLSTALAQDEARSHAAFLVGPPAGGALFGISRALPFVTDAVSYAVSFICVVLARIPRRAAAGTTGANAATGANASTGADAAAGSSGEAAVETPPGGAPRTGLRREITDGLAWLLRQPLLRAMLLLLPAMNVAGAGIPLLMVILLRSQGVSSGVIGFVLAAQGAAGLIGALASARIGRLAPPGQLLLVIVWSWAALVALMAVPLGTWWLAVLLGLGALLTPAMGVIINTYLMSNVPEQLLGRTVSTLYTFAGLVSPLGPLAAGVLAQAIGPVTALLCFGGYIAACALVATAGPMRRSGTLAPSQRVSAQRSAPESDSAAANLPVQSGAPADEA